MSVLDVMGFHEYDIQKAYDMACDILDEYDISSVGLLDDVMSDIQYSFNWNNPTDSIIGKIFSNAQAYLESENVKSDFEVNGSASYFKIEEEQQLEI
jgi:hypothetical protein